MSKQRKQSVMETETNLPQQAEWQEDIFIDPEFENIFPPKTEEQNEKLEELLLRDGCRDGLVCWKEKGILLDGHGRYAICKKHGIPYTVHLMSFESRDEAVMWVLDNQLARRNLNTFARVEVALKHEPVAVAQTAGVHEPQHAGSDSLEDAIDK